MMLLDEFFPDAFGHAAKHTDDEAAPLPLQTVEELQAGDNLLLRIVAHRASVQEHSIGLVQILRHLIAGHAHHAGHNLAVCHVHLATVCLYQQFLHIHNGAHSPIFAAKILLFGEKSDFLHTKCFFPSVYGVK